MQPQSLWPRFVALLGALSLTAAFSGCPGEIPSSPDAAGNNGEGGKWTSTEPIIHTMEGDGPPTVAYVTNGIASFWVIAEKGARAAGEEFNAHVEVRMPPDGVADQKRMLEELLTLGVDGMAVSPVDSENQTDLLNLCAEQTNLITHDSDAPKSRRMCYVGMSNYDAGRMCGELVREAIPDGGEVMIFVGRIEQDNARLRRQGVIDELLQRTYDPTRFDEPGKVIEGSGFTILGTRTDGFDFGKAKALAEDTLTAHPDIRCMVGLFAYNPPTILEALRSAGKLGEVEVVAFDEQNETLQAIIDGSCFGTIVQNPYRYGYESVRILAALARGDQSVLPERGFLDIPARKITNENVKEFWTELKSLVGDGGDAD
jgi:ribose transport system substrate-binding protein